MYHRLSLTRQWIMATFININRVRGWVVTTLPRMKAETRLTNDPTWTTAAKTNKNLRVSLHNLATWHLTLHHSNL